MKRTQAFLLPLVVVLLAFVSVRAARADEPLLDGPGKEWRTGPVRHVLTKEEDKHFKSLKSDEERKAAIEAFWAARDTTPGTPRNEYKEVFYARLQYVMNEFTEGSAGWVSDRGRMYLVAGPPDETSFHSDTFVWTYTRTFPSGKFGGKRTRFELGFHRGYAITYPINPEAVSFLVEIQKLGPLGAAEFSMGH